MESTHLPRKPFPVFDGSPEASGKYLVLSQSAFDDQGARDMLNVSKLLPKIKESLTTDTPSSKALRDQYEPILRAAMNSTKVPGDTDLYLREFFDKKAFSDVYLDFHLSAETPCSTTLHGERVALALNPTYADALQDTTNPSTLFISLLLIASVYHELAHVLWEAHTKNKSGEPPRYGFDLERNIFGGVLCPIYSKGQDEDASFISGLHLIHVRVALPVLDGVEHCAEFPASRLNHEECQKIIEAFESMDLLRYINVESKQEQEDQGMIEFREYVSRPYPRCCIACRLAYGAPEILITSDYWYIRTGDRDSILRDLQESLTGDNEVSEVLRKGYVPILRYLSVAEELSMHNADQDDAVIRSFLREYDFSRVHVEKQPDTGTIRFEGADQTPYLILDPDLVGLAEEERDSAEDLVATVLHQLGHAFWQHVSTGRDDLPLNLNLYATAFISRPGNCSICRPLSPTSQLDEALSEPESDESTSDESDSEEDQRSDHYYQSLDSDVESDNGLNSDGEAPPPYPVSASNAA